MFSILLFSASACLLSSMAVMGARCLAVEMIGNRIEEVKRRGRQDER
jgi:hypothetical protein